MWIALSLLFSGLLAASECTVDGHGPYDMDREQCYELCKNQASTDCILKKKTSTSVIEFVVGGKKETLNCRYRRSGKECRLDLEPTPVKK